MHFNMHTNTTGTTATISNTRPICSVSEEPTSPSQNKRMYKRCETYDQSDDNNSDDERDTVSVQAHEDDSDDNISHASLNMSFIKFMMNVADALNISQEEPRVDKEDVFTSYVPQHVSNKSKSDSIRVRLPLDGMVLEALDSVDK